jgi:hypothetical protein
MGGTEDHAKLRSWVLLDALPLLVLQIGQTPQEKVYFPDPLNHWPARVGFPGFNPPERNTFLEPGAARPFG